MIAISSISFGEDVEREVLDTLRSGMVAQGPKVARFEEGFAELVGARHAVAVNSGTTALIAALRVLDLQPGDEVLTTRSRSWPRSTRFSTPARRPGSRTSGRPISRSTPTPWRSA